MTFLSESGKRWFFSTMELPHIIFESTGNSGWTFSRQMNWSGWSDRLAGTLIRFEYIRLLRLGLYQSCIRDDIQNEICNKIIATFQTIIPDMAQHSKFLGESNFACKCKESTSSSCYIRSVRIEWIKPTEENHFKKNVPSYLKVVWKFLSA